MIQAFNEYLNTLDIKDEKVMSIIKQVLEEASLAKKYALKLGYSNKEQDLSYNVTLLNNIGLLEKIRNKKEDESVLAYQYFFKNKNIDNYNLTDEETELLHEVIKNENPNLFKKYKKLIKDVRIVFIIKSALNNFDKRKNVNKLLYCFKDVQNDIILKDIRSYLDEIHNLFKGRIDEEIYHEIEKYIKERMKLYVR